MQSVPSSGKRNPSGTQADRVNKVPCPRHHPQSSGLRASHPPRGLSADWFQTRTFLPAPFPDCSIPLPATYNGSSAAKLLLGTPHAGRRLLPPSRNPIPAFQPHPAQSADRPSDRFLFPAKQPSAASQTSERGCLHQEASRLILRSSPPRRAILSYRYCSTI